MSSVNETKDHHWKMIVNRKNRMQQVFQSSATKKKFTPLKDNSMRDSKIFQRSRQRSNSSFAGLNKSRDIDTVSIRDRKHDKMLESVKPMHPQTSVLISTVKNSEFRLTDSVQFARQHASAINSMVELQKQFKQFKEKVIKLLQRQQQQISQLAKEIVNTFQFQLSKIKDLKVSKCEHCLLESSSPKQESKSLQPQKILSTNSKIHKQFQNKSKAKGIQQIKQQINQKLQNLQKYESPVKNEERTKILQKSRSTRDIPILNFQKIHSRFENVFDIFSKLKSDMNQMQEIRASLQRKTLSSVAIPQIDMTSPLKTKQ